MNNDPVRVLVTRPEPQASDWSRGLVARGVHALALPLLATVPDEHRDDVARAWGTLDRLDGVMFVSPAAAQAWLDARPQGAAWPARVWVAAPGPGTARVLAALGANETLAPAADAAQFDTDALWAVIAHRDWRGKRILVVHGGAGREDLAARWRAAGAEVDRLQAYRRADATWTAAQQAAFDEALNDPASHVWLFSSADAIDRLERRAKPRAEALHRPPTKWPSHRALCTHPAIAERARRAGFGNVRECRAEVDAVAAQVRD